MPVCCHDVRPMVQKQLDTLGATQSDCKVKWGPSSRVHLLNVKLYRGKTEYARFMQDSWRSCNCNNNILSIYNYIIDNV